MNYKLGTRNYKLGTRNQFLNFSQVHNLLLARALRVLQQQYQPPPITLILHNSTIYTSVQLHSCRRPLFIAHPVLQKGSILELRYGLYDWDIHYSSMPIPAYWGKAGCYTSVSFNMIPRYYTRRPSCKQIPSPLGQSMLIRETIYLPADTVPLSERVGMRDHLLANK